MLASSSEGTAFVAELSKIEAFRSNQKVAEVAVKYGPCSISTTGKLVAVGGDVSYIVSDCLFCVGLRSSFRTTECICMIGMEHN